MKSFKNDLQIGQNDLPMYTKISLKKKKGKIATKNGVKNSVNQT